MPLALTATSPEAWATSAELAELNAAVDALPEPAALATIARLSDWLGHHTAETVAQLEPITADDRDTARRWALAGLVNARRVAAVAAFRARHERTGRVW